MSLFHCHIVVLSLVYKKEELTSDEVAAGSTTEDELSDRILAVETADAADYVLVRT